MSTTSQQTIREHVQAGIDARVDQPVLEAGAVIGMAEATILGRDGSSVDDVVEAAYVPGGPSREILRQRIAWRRGHPGASSSEHRAFLESLPGGYRPPFATSSTEAA